MISPLPTLTTERLTLRPLAESDVQEIFLLRSDPRTNRYLDRKPSETTKEALTFIRNIKNNGLLYWAITKTDSDKLIGTICLFDFSEDVKKCEMGYELLTDYQGQGFMGEAIAKVIAYATHNLGVATIDAFTHKDNQASTQLLQKSNFKKTDIIFDANPNLIIFRFTILF